LPVIVTPVALFATIPGSPVQEAVSESSQRIDQFKLFVEASVKAKFVMVNLPPPDWYSVPVYVPTKSVA
jgi:hypothetical protein